MPLTKKDIKKAAKKNMFNIGELAKNSNMTPQAVLQYLMGKGIKPFRKCQKTGKFFPVKLTDLVKDGEQEIAIVETEQ